MKNRIFVFVMLILAGLLAGCGHKSEVVADTELFRAPAVDYGKEKITVGFVQTGKESDWRDANSNDFINTFTDARGYNLIYIDGNSDSDRQKKAVYDLINQGVDYIILDPIVEDGWEEPLLFAKEKGIPVIISDRAVNVDEDLYACWIGSDFQNEGEKAIEWLEEYLTANNRMDDDINIVLLEGTQGASASIGRTEGLLNGIKKHPNWRIVAQECGNFTQGEGKTVMEKILSQQTIDIDVLIAENDNMMFGAMKAMKARGIEYGTKGGVITISFDALHEAFLKMISGELHVTVECNPLIAGLSEKVIRDLEEGKEVDKLQYVEEEVFTYETAYKFVSNRKY